MNIAVFASGGGSNFQALINKNHEGELHCTFGLLVGNNSKAKCFERAKRNSIPYLHIAPSHFENEKQYSEKLLQELYSRKIELIVLAGYMKKIPSLIIKKYSNRIINIHPALLPSFGGKGMYGKHVHRAVLDYGAKVTGITVHFVDEEYDHGAIILQETVKVLTNDDTDSLAARVLVVEHEYYWKAIEAIIQGSIKIEGRKVIDIK
ncbi:MAG: phosphoribosylglycinamide formyltransferase [Chitinispirillia bacterium]|jgi:phosphoribosylglycinamide formyltransferase-1